MIQKIDSVFLYGSIDVEDTYICYNILESSNIKINYLYSCLSEQDNANVFSILNNWTFGMSQSQHTYTTLPIIVWRVFDDSGSVYAEFAESSSQLNNSNLILHKDLIQNG